MPVFSAGNTIRALPGCAPPDLTQRLRNWSEGDEEARARDLLYMRVVAADQANRPQKAPAPEGSPVPGPCFEARCVGYSG